MDISGYGLNFRSLVFDRHLPAETQHGFYCVLTYANVIMYDNGHDEITINSQCGKYAASITAVMADSHTFCVCPI